MQSQASFTTKKQTTLWGDLMLSIRDVKAVVFELDGTLVDSAAGIQVAAEEMLDDLDLPHINAAHMSDLMGDGFQKLIHRVLTRQFDGKAPDALFREGSTLFLKAYQKMSGTHLKLYPGVETCLKKLSHQNIPQVVLTSQKTSQATKILTSLGIRHYFQFVLGHDALIEPKPSPAGLLEAALLLRLSPEELIMVGESVNDISAAKSAGSPVACVSYGYNYGIDIRKGRANFILDSLDELPALLNPRMIVDRHCDLTFNASS